MSLELERQTQQLGHVGSSAGTVSELGCHLDCPRERGVLWSTTFTSACIVGLAHRSKPMLHTGDFHVGGQGLSEAPPLPQPDSSHWTGHWKLPLAQADTPRPMEPGGSKDGVIHLWVTGSPGLMKATHNLFPKVVLKGANWLWRGKFTRKEGNRRESHRFLL